MKRNKLRKIVCNKSCKDLNVTWDEFQEILDGLVEAEKVTSAEDADGSASIALVGSAKGALGEGAEAAAAAAAAEAAKPAPPFSDSAKVEGEEDWVKKEASIPKMVAQHLLKRGKQKLTNIEVNTKTKIKFLEVFLDKEGKCAALPATVACNSYLQQLPASAIF
jgi:hypothetical protein